MANNPIAYEIEKAKLLILLSKYGIIVKRRDDINKNDEHNPGGQHEMHTIEHAEQLRIESYTELGSFNDELEAIQKTKEKYSDANGCAICCPKADTDRKHNR